MNTVLAIAFFSTLFFSTQQPIVVVHGSIYSTYKQMIIQRYATNQKFGIIRISIFWKKTLLLTKVAFILLKKQKPKN